MLIDAGKYFEWYKITKDHNYIFAWKVCFTFLLTFQVYTEAICKNNHDLMMAFSVAFAPLFYGRIIHATGEVHLRDLVDRVRCPKVLQADIAANEFFSLSGIPNKVWRNSI